MKQTAIEWLLEVVGKKGLVGLFTREELNQFEEIEKQQQGYSEEEVELIANEMVNWAIDNVGNPFPQSGKKFDEVLAKYKKK